MKITIKPELCLEHANLPRFNFRLSWQEGADYEDPEFYKIAEGKYYMHIPTRDGLACKYQVVCEKADQGNPLFAWGRFESGWSSRVGVTNVIFDKQYVECAGYGLDVETALELIHDTYAEPVAVYMDVSEHDLHYGIAPYHLGKTRSFDEYTDRYLVMNPTHPDFVQAAMEWFYLSQPQLRHKLFTK